MVLNINEISKDRILNSFKRYLCFGDHLFYENVSVVYTLTI